MRLSLRWLILFWALLAAAAVWFALRPGMPASLAPSIGVLLALFWSRAGLSVWASIVLAVFGLAIDVLYEGPFGAWALAYVAAYGGALVARGAPPAFPLADEVLAIVAAVVGAMGAILLASSISGQGVLWRAGLFLELLVAVIVYVGGRVLVVAVSARKRQG